MGQQWKQWLTLFWGCSKVTADGDCSHEIKRFLLLERKVRTKLESILKSRDIILSTKVCLVKAMVFSSSHVWMWELDYKKSWAPKNWCFWTVVLEKTLESPLDCKEIQLKESILKEISPGCSLEGLMLKLKLQSLATWCKELTHLQWLCWWERFKARGEGDDREWDGWMASPNRWTWVWASSRKQWWTGKPGMLQSVGLPRVRHD